MTILQADSNADINAIEILANEIWQEHFTPLIGKDQVEYMLEKFQSATAIKEQIKQGYIYLIMQHEGHSIGYASLIPNAKKNSLQLSKFYLLQRWRGQGLGRELLGHIEHLCRDQLISTIWLTVNRHNSSPIAAYEKMGFIKTDEIVQDIGSGYVMDDFVMEKRLSSQP